MIVKVLKLIENCRHIDFCLVKVHDIIEEYERQDIDIFTLNKDEFTNYIISTYTLSTGTIKVNITNNYNHIDFIDKKKKLILRLDVIEHLGHYKNIIYKRSFLECAVASKNTKTILCCGESFILPTPNSYYDLLIRYMEYHEYINIRGDKIKHIEYINNRINNSKINKELFFSLFHHFVSFPSYKVTKIKIYKRKLINFYHTVFYYPILVVNTIHYNGWKYLIIKVKEKLKL